MPSGAGKRAVAGLTFAVATAARRAANPRRSDATAADGLVRFEGLPAPRSAAIRTAAGRPATARSAAAASSGRARSKHREVVYCK
jgi:hypothetical protein